MFLSSLFLGYIVFYYVEAIKKRLHVTMQNYTNGGLLLLEKNIEEENLDITISTSMLDLILKSKQ